MGIVCVFKRLACIDQGLKMLELDDYWNVIIGRVFSLVLRAEFGLDFSCKVMNYLLVPESMSEELAEVP